MVTLQGHGGEYDLMVDWEKRLKNELPFLFEFLDNKGVQKVLEVGCATGRHSIEVAQRGFQVVGIDLEPTMIEIAQARAKEEELSVEFFAKDFLDAQSVLSAKFDALYCLGNTTALIAAESSYQEVFENFGAFLKPGGILIFHMLNFERERSGWSSPRYVEHAGEEFLFLRRFETSGDLLRVEIVTLRRRSSPMDNWELTTRNSEFTRISRNKVKKFLLEADFVDLEFYGDYQSSPFTSEAIDLITVAKKFV